jgi:hypothetical protein
MFPNIVITFQVTRSRDVPGRESTNTTKKLDARQKTSGMTEEPFAGSISMIEPAGNNV